MEVFVSLDVVELGRAIRIALEAWSAGIRHIEVGTPLIKSEGVRAIRALREALPEAVIFADTKTADVGSLEARMALEAGADIMSVLGAAPDATIRSAVAAARELGGTVLVDSLGLGDRIFERARVASRLGAEMICLHKGVDEGVFSDEGLLTELRGLGVKIGAAGGLDPEGVSKLVGLADFVMVGRYVTGSEDPRGAAARVLEAARNSR
ncbi:MAG: orotidine 5'-phosphate decarboxylase [Candidatus Korarchaeota archaeon]|nr:orotidine 5'-phosphate decarboxylase [Candidatus Korarchaeota archaeon]